MKLNTSVRWSEECIRKADALAKKMGVSRSAIVEIAIRNLAMRPFYGPKKRNK
jgi:predicted transcriptional regulator